ncbi:MAG: hypothetical protein DRZ79_00135 [Candidatus Cloacimonadota bacterium]|nr:MAG: hypothetical protein DRZ79_00135 [Candidatus Cloacimonadota bacterium]
MEYQYKDLEKFQNLAFKYALYKLEEEEAAKEVASQTLSLFILKSDKIENIKSKQWIISTCKTFCKEFFRKNTKRRKNEFKFRNDILEKIRYKDNNETNEALIHAYNESYNTLSNKELKLILFYFQCGESVSEMHALLGGSYSTLRQQISRIKRKLKAETFKKLGYIATKKIVSPQLNDLITKFIQRFKDNLEKNTLYKMYYYFSEKDLKNYNPDYDIEKVMDYEIELNNSIYKVWVFFKNKKQESDSFFIEFYINEKNFLKIITPPTKPKKFIKLKTDSVEGKKIKQLLNQYPPDKSGKSQIPSALLEEIINQIKKGT